MATSNLATSKDVAPEACNTPGSPSPTSPSPRRGDGVDPVLFPNEAHGLCRLQHHLTQKEFLSNCHVVPVDALDMSLVDHEAGFVHLILQLPHELLKGFRCPLLDARLHHFDATLHAPQLFFAFELPMDVVRAAPDLFLLHVIVHVLVLFEVQVVAILDTLHRHASFIDTPPPTPSSAAPESRGARPNARPTTPTKAPTPARCCQAPTATPELSEALAALLRAPRAAIATASNTAAPQV
eukprot:CAMPEP_0177552218 /NCGR_PEP_ID=MMETSP0369-20130122/66685_1 /TAXON_ID=447022 ORGANISM="Scrippsiella hangoei-like, Strain SHHI-4" /NCGR_SAMPLE_ID=MMETSP0369 /ASSEMBLY_ACC=CAM_ASM_000364 /LENGTH=238 /DNA_ID=CAMNT_0019037865 /DNA_START=218 /DNA_END=931 /DNA_ORIENTATION=-